MFKNNNPTDKQIKTIWFINNRLNMNIEAKTKQQCIEDIGKYLKKAKEANVCYSKRCLTDEECDIYGIDSSMFY